jgi:gliding motility-associated-like protein
MTFLKKRHTIGYFCFIFSLFFVTQIAAQPTSRLDAYFSFDQCDGADGSEGAASNGVLVGNPECGCGVKGSALKMDGIDDYALLLGKIKKDFSITDFTLSFFMKPQGSIGTQDIFSKRADCTTKNAFAIRYSPSSQSINVLLSEDKNKAVNMNERLPSTNCWHHIVIVRNRERVLIYVNGKYKQEARTTSVVNLTNGAELAIANSPCLSTSESRYAGYLDEIRLYNRALLAEEVRELSIASDQITNRDTLVFLGSTAKIGISKTCAATFEWLPAAGVADPLAAQTTIKPTETTTYALRFIHDACVSVDSIKITVIDPDSLDCTKALLPTAFTPNGDGRNETYGISNAHVLRDLVSFEIFDRWGGRVFFTPDAFTQWNGMANGQPVNPGTFFYRVRFKCKGKEETNVGSLTVLR